MKKIHRVLALLLAALMALGLMTTAFAATDSAPTIDPGKKASLSVYKYDITKASNDGAWDAESYVSTGLHDDTVIDKLSKYAIQGVEFTYLRVADIAMNSELVDGQRRVGVLYGFDSSDRSTAVLSAIGLTAADAHKTDNSINYFTSDMLNNKLSTALTANATTVKNALETAVKNGGVAMSETDVTGHTSASDMEQGLYLVVETRVPENVTSTCNPFFVSLPMTTIDGAAWNYVIWGGINGLYQVAGGITKPFRRRIQQKTGARTNTLSWRIGQVLTTFVLIDLSWIFFRANSLGDAMHLLSSLFRGWSTSIFFDGSLLKLGLDQTEWLVLLGALLILLAVSLMQERGVSVLEAVKRQQLWFRWLIYLAAIFVVLLTGIYGPGFAASSFIYFQF